jgi:hypothetical protein
MIDPYLFHPISSIPSPPSHLLHLLSSYSISSRFIAAPSCDSSSLHYYFFTFHIFTKELIRSKGEESSRNAEFEKNNGAFCSQYVDDMKVREKAVTKKHESADSYRLKGMYVQYCRMCDKTSYNRQRDDMINDFTEKRSADKVKSREEKNIREKILRTII